MRRSLHKPRFWVLTAAALLLGALTFSLGQWQLRRAAQKQALHDAIELQTRQAVLDNHGLAGSSDMSASMHRQAALKGTWRPEYTVFLDNRPMNQKSGFIVVAPLMLEGTSQAILVQRGWVQRDFNDRARVPDIQTPLGPVTVRGRIAPPPSKLYEFKGVDSGRVRQNIDVAGFAREIAIPLLGVSLVQTGPPSEGLLRDWAPPDLGIQKHYGYALQWFALCTLVTCLYLWFQLINPLWTARRSAYQKVSHPDQT